MSGDADHPPKTNLTPAKAKWWRYGFYVVQAFLIFDAWALLDGRRYARVFVPGLTAIDVGVAVMIAIAIRGNQQRVLPYFVGILLPILWSVVSHAVVTAGFSPR